MADFLTLNGIPVPVLDGSAHVSVDELGEASRAVDGSLLIGRRNLKTKLDFDVVHQDAATALAFRDLILGRGNVWSFDSSLYSAKGVPVTMVGSYTLYTMFKKYGTGSLQVQIGTSADFADGPDYTAQPWSISWWDSGGGAWDHYVENSANQQYKNGSLTGARTYCTPSSTKVRWTNPYAGTRWVDDVWLAPYLFPSTWPAKIQALGAAVGSAARVRAAGLALNANAGPLTMKGSIRGLNVLQGTLAGVYAANLHVVSATLEEC